MKKEAIFILLIILGISIVSARSSCSDNSSVISDQNEIKIGSSKIISGLGIGITKTTETNLIRSSNVIGRITADLIADTRRLELSNKSSFEEIELLTGKYTVSLSDAAPTKVKITIDGESKEMEEGIIETIKNLFVMLGNLEESGEDAPRVKLIIGSKQLFLSSDEKPSEKLIFGNITYLIELVSASESVNAVVKVSICKTGEIIYLIDTPQQTTLTNQTSNNTASNETTTNNESNTENESVKQVTVEEVRERLRKLNETQSNESSETTIEKSGPSYGFFKRIINWIKKLFGWG